MIGDIIIESRMTRTSRISLFRSFHLLIGVKTSRDTGGHGSKGSVGESVSVVCLSKKKKKKFCQVR